jgi:hypothetical protein
MQVQLHLCGLAADLIPAQLRPKASALRWQSEQILWPGQQRFHQAVGISPSNPGLNAGDVVLHFLAAYDCAV